MRKERNLKAIIAGLIIVIIGILMVLLDLFWINTKRGIWISIGCSLLASGVVILFQALLVDVKDINPMDEWGMVRIYKKRSDKGQDSDKDLDKAKHQLDCIAFGLKAFRRENKNKIKKLLNNNVNIRILTMNPDPNNYFLKQREQEEDEPEGQIRQSINELVQWANDLNRKYPNGGKITVKGYKCMTLDFYWRVDNELYVGPYWYKHGSQQTITYKFVEGKKGFSVYSEYFEELWGNDENTIVLTRK